MIGRLLFACSILTLLIMVAGCGPATCHDLCEKQQECDTPLVQGNCHETCSAGADEKCQAVYDCLSASTCDEIWSGKCNNIKCY